MTAGRGVRAIRAAVFAAVCVLLAALGHVLMSETGVPWRTLAAGAAVTGAAAWCLAEHERAPLPVVAITTVVQAGLHTTFTLARSAPSPAVPMHHHTGAMDSMAPVGHGMTGGGMSTGMLAAHLLAALLSGLWLAHGERAAFRILRAVAGWFAAPLRLPVRACALPHRPPRIPARRHRGARTPRRLLLVHALTTRGPPVGTAVV